MPHGPFCHGRQKKQSEQKKIRPHVTDFTACRHLFTARHATRCLPHNRISRLIAAHTCLLDFAIAVQTTVQTKCTCVYTTFTIEYQRVASKSAECRQKHKYWQTRARAREYTTSHASTNAAQNWQTRARAREHHVHTMQRRMHKSAFNVIKTRVMKENA